MKIPLLDLQAQYKSIKKEIDDAVLRVLESGKYIMSDEVKKLEDRVATYCGAKYGIGVASGTDALVLILDAKGIKKGDEVITTPFTFFATAEAISRIGANPVFVDIDYSTFNINPEKIHEKITGKTKAIIVVHLFGLPAEMDEVMRISKEEELFIIEDACQAIGAVYKDKKVGSIGDTGVFSFFPSKNLGGAGDGGMVVTDDGILTEKIRKLRTHGSSEKYYHDILGYNSRLDSLQAAVLNVKINYLDEWNMKKREISKIYNEEFKSLPIIVPDEPKGLESVFHLYTLKTSERDRLLQHLRAKEIGCGIYYPLPLHLQKVYEQLGYRENDLPVSEKASKEALSIPIFPEMNEEKIKYVVSSVKEFF
jgi:dTDP-4-amino-4,6-dideoxygalactose transaminase